MNAGWRRWLGRTGIVLASTILGLLVCEVTLRLVVAFDLLADDNPLVALVRSVDQGGPSADEPGQQLFRPSTNRGLGWEPVPGFESGHIRINSAGFRGPEVEKRPTAGTLRIAFLGDSETFGMRLPEEHTVPGFLEAALNERLPDQKIEVLNFGVPGYNTPQERELLETRVMEFHPTAVVLYYSLNDPEIEDRTLLMGDSLWRRSYLYLLYVSVRQSWSGLLSLRTMARGEAEYYHLLHASEYFDQTRATIAAMADHLTTDGVPFFLVISPALSGYDDLQQFPYWEIHRRLGELETLGLQIVDPTAEIVARYRDPRQLWVAPEDAHKNHLANQIIGEVVAGALAERLDVKKRAEVD